MLSKEEINTIVADEERNAIGFIGEGSELSSNRRKLLDYYNAQPYGDEIDGQSQVITSDVADVVEGMLPSLMRIYTQGKNMAVFESDIADLDEEAKQKTAIANYIFHRKNDGVPILYSMIKDGLLQYTGACKVYWDEKEEKVYSEYRNLSEMEYQKLNLDEDTEILEDEEEMTEAGLVHHVKAEKTKKVNGVQIDPIPPEELLINRDARDFIKPRMIGHRTPVTRSTLIKMGFSEDVVMGLPSDKAIDTTETKQARFHNIEGPIESNPSNHMPNDTIYLGEYYMELDADEDGVTELYQIFRAGEQVLEFKRVDMHPFCVFVPIPIPHRAIGTCPAEQAADIQFIKSTLARQMQNNIYQTNYSRLVYNNRADLDDLFTPRAGGGVHIDTDGPVTGSVEPLVVQPMVDGIRGAIEYWDTAREVRTGVTRYNQGMDAESLNKTATGFLGLRDMSQQRMELVARMGAEGGFREIFRKIIALVGKYQNESMQIRVSGAPMEIDPTAWQENLDCRIDVGIGSGDRQEKIANLNFIFQQQKEMMDRGLVLSDQAKMFATLDKLVTEVGLKEAGNYFNDPELPQEVLQAQNEQMKEVLTQMQAQQENPLVEVERARTEGRLMEQQAKQDKDLAMFMADKQQEDKEFRADLMARLTEMELKYNKDVPGSSV